MHGVGLIKDSTLPIGVGVTCRLSLHGPVLVHSQLITYWPSVCLTVFTALLLPAHQPWLPPRKTSQRASQHLKVDLL